MDDDDNAAAAMATSMEGPTNSSNSGGDASPPTSYALVPFSFRNPFHDALRDATRWFPIAGRRLRIEQGWKPDGRGGTSIGFGASVYDAAVLLALYLESHKHDVLGKRVLELGCGPGLVGIAAAHCGAKSVIITDGDPASVALTQRNIELNGLPSEVTTECRAAEYLWGDDANPIANDDQAYDVILGADIVACPYAGAFESLLKSFQALSNGKTLLLLAYKLRHGSEQKFFAPFEKEFDVRQVDASELHQDFQQGDIVLYRARLKQQSASPQQ
ncbi:putative methyltransferase [Globisporangium polare]